MSPRPHIRLVSVIPMLAALLVFAPRGAEAMPANPEPVDVRQPDGSVVTLRVFGDEYFHWYADQDGYTVVTAHGAYVYASLDDDGELAPTEWAVGKADPAAVGLVPAVLPAARVRAEGRVAATHQALAEEVGTAREVVSRQLDALAKAGLVRTARGEVTLLDRAALEARGAL